MGDFSILAIRIKKLRASMNMTQKEFSTFVGCTAATLSAYENGSKSPSLEIIKGVAEKCNISIDWLCGLSEKKNSSDEIKTYTDIIRLLFKLENVLDFNLSTETILKETFPPCQIAKIIFNNFEMYNFIDDWKKMKELHDENIIDDGVYSLWAEKILKDYDDVPAVGLGWDNLDTPPQS